MEETAFRFLLNGRTQVLSVSESAITLLGYSPRAFLASEVQLAERIHPQDADVAELLFSPDIHAGCGRFNVRVRDAEGHIRCVCGDCAKKTCANGDTVLNLILRDAKSVRCDLEQGDFSCSLQTLMESQEDCVYFKDRNHVLTAANMSTKRALSADSNTPIELIGLTDYDLFPEEVADHYYLLEKQLFARRQAVHEVEDFVDEQGKRLWNDIRRYPVRDDAGEIIGLFGIASDITQGVEAQHNLHEAADSLRESQRIAGLGSFVVDLPKGVWKSSDVLDEIFGIDQTYSHELAGWEALVHPEDREATQAYFRDVVATGSRFDREYRIIRSPDGAERWVRAFGALDFDKAGNPLAMRGMIQDTTKSKQVEAELRESKELLQLFIHDAPAALAMLDKEMRFLAVSRRWKEDFGLNGREILGVSHYEVFPDVPERWKESHKRALAGEASSSDEDRYERADGSVMWLHWIVRPWLTGTGAVGGVILFTEDITGRKLAEERLHLAASVFTHASEGIAITDAFGTILDANDAFTRITGYARSEVVGRNPRILNSGRQSQEFYAKMWRQLIDSGQWSGEIWNRAKDGHIYAELLTISAVRDAAGMTQQYVAMFSDLTSIKEQEERLDRIRHFDLLTGLPNRALLRDRLHQAMAQAHRRGRMLAVACLDLDNFKSINDQYGHATGDRFLTALAQRMKQELHEDDTFAHLGGDEFVAVVQEFTTLEEFRPIWTSLLAAASEKISLDDLTLRVSASLGVTYFPQTDDVDADQLLRQAAQAMYQSKLEGKNRIHVFDSKHDRTVRGHHEDLERVRQGLAANEFILYYQPKVNMSTGAVLGAEALIRWQHPERALLPPGVFLPIVEGHPLAIELGEWVIEKALIQLEQWREDGLDIPVSVNVSAQLLQDAAFSERLAAILARHPGIPPSRLEIEVLESSALEDLVHVTQVIYACSRLGVTFALDDFGTGYSSLSYLKRLPIETLKIDQTFVRDMLDDPEDLTILEGMLGLATAFRRQAIAEGVETLEHGLLLLRMGCQLGQGYGIARPMPASEFPEWSRTWRPFPQWRSASPLDPNDRPLLYASAEHSAWVAAIEAFLRGQRRNAPDMDPHQCRFGAWMNGGHGANRVGLPVFREIEEEHQLIHKQASEILRLKAEGRALEATNRLPRLHEQRDRLLDQLSGLMGRD